MDGISPVNPASTADADADADVTTEAKATIPKPTVAASKEEAPKARGDDPHDSLLFFSGLLKTHRSMEREARAAKISNLRIV